MALESAFQRLALRPSSICRQCRRTFASTAHQRQPQSEAGAFAEALETSRANALKATRSPRPAALNNAAPTTTSTANSAAGLTPPNSPSDALSAQRTGWDIAADSMRVAAVAGSKKQEEQRLRDLERTYSRRDLETQVHRRWRDGDVYAPHDLSGAEMSKWRRTNNRGPREKVRWDAIDQLGINPIDHYKNFSIMSEYISEMGRIKHSRETGLRPVNQRRMAKAIRRAMGTGLLMPGTYRHPELLRIEMDSKARRG